MAEERHPRSVAAADKTLSRSLLEALLFALVLAVFARTWVVQAFKIPTGSMEDNLLVGDHILVNKFIFGPTVHPLEEALLPIRDPRRGDVAVFKYPEDPGRDFIKRCLGLPGEEVDLRDKRLFVDGERVDESGYTRFADDEVYPDWATIPDYYRLRDQFGPFEVPAGHYLFLGDNRDNSHDSRYWGPIPQSSLKGRALLVYWSVIGEERPREGFREGEGLTQWLGRISRWDRVFSLVR